MPDLCSDLNRKKARKGRWRFFKLRAGVSSLMLVITAFLDDSHQ